MIRASLIALLASSALAACSGGVARIPRYQVVPDTPFVLKGVVEVKQVAKLTGAEAINDTDRYAVAGTDLGSMVNMGEATYFVFGDTFGYRKPGMTGGGGEDWRSNVMAVASDDNPADGITFDRFIAGADNHASELIPSLKRDGAEITTIPTHGLAVGSAMYLYYMSVNHWGPAGVWVANHAGAYKSVDGGQVWTEVEGLRWEGESNFIQVSPAQVQNADGTVDLYFWGIPAGRFGGVKLMKVPEAELEQLASYRYFAGTDNAGQPQWTVESDAAALVVDDTVGELSVVWNAYLERWIMTYLRGGGGVVMREGIHPWGPWGEPISVLTQADFPGLYGPYMNPKFVEDGGRTIYFTLSQWGPYAVYWMKATLVKAGE